MGVLGSPVGIQQCWKSLQRRPQGCASLEGAVCVFEGLNWMDRGRAGRQAGGAGREGGATGVSSVTLGGAQRKETPRQEGLQVGLALEPA